MKYFVIICLFYLLFYGYRSRKKDDDNDNDSFIYPT